MSAVSEAGPITPDEARELVLAPQSVYATESVLVGGVEHRVFRHAPRNLGELYALAARHDERTFLVYEDEVYTFAEARRRAASFARALQTEHGVQKGDRVALAMRNYPEWCFTYMAVTSLGGVVVPLNAWWQGAELLYGIEDSGSRVAVVDQERLDRLQPLVAGRDVQLLVARPEGAPTGGARDVAPLFEGEGVGPDVDVEPDADATILYTSGSTGEPKGVVSTHRAVVGAIFTWESLLYGRLLAMLPPALCDRVVSWMHTGPAALTSSPLNLPQTCMLITLPLFHVTGANVQFLPAFRSGRKLVMMHKWNPERALELIEREKVTDFSGVPTMSWELVNSPDFDKRDTSTLRSLSAGGAARPPEHVKHLKERASGALPSTGYGMTETNSLGAAIGGDEYLARPASVGRALPPLVELRVVDEAGGEVPAGAEGEVLIKSSTNMRGYWGKPAETAETLRDGWIHTGDLGCIDSDGFLFITGRAKDIVIRGGENVSCTEVENALYTHPAVFEAAVFAVPDERLGEAVGATIMLHADHDATQDELRAHVATQLAAFKVPSHVWLTREPLPRLGSGKIDKRTLKAEAGARVGQP